MCGEREEVLSKLMGTKNALPALGVYWHVAMGLQGCGGIIQCLPHLCTQWHYLISSHAYSKIGLCSLFLGNSCFSA